MTVTLSITHVIAPCNQKLSYLSLLGSEGYNVWVGERLELLEMDLNCVIVGT